MPADLNRLLSAAVDAVGGTTRPGQVRMAEAVTEAVARDEHLLVQAGTGTGKSLAYLVPAIAHAFNTGHPVVVATATLALQAQIVDRDLPRIAAGLAPLLGRTPTYTLVKGRRNYVCVHKLAGGYPDDEGALLELAAVDAARSRLGEEVTRVREWAEHTGSGDRDELVPGVSERAWRQVSVAARECLGSARCPMAAACFVERARDQARDVDVIVTNHSFMAIDSVEGRQMLPEHKLLIVDEAHELVDRVTSTITDELTSAAVEGAVRKVGRVDAAEDLSAAAALLALALDALPAGRLAAGLPEALATAVGQVQGAARAAQSELKGADGDADTGRAVAKATVDELFDVAERLLEEREIDVAWVSDEPWRGKVLRVAPMSVAMLLRDKVFGDRTVVLTSATLELGGTFDAIAGTFGLRGDGAPAWQGLDVGSPFDYPRQAIVYVARHLPPPGRDGTSQAALDEIEALVRAAGGRTLGLFSSMRAAQTAAEEMRARFADELTILCQGEDQLPTLVRQFARESTTCLFGTISLWQGVDVPGPACQLVLIDRIPFPRPDDPLASARTQAIARMGGNGFMAVSATHAALRLAQGAGRLIRRADDRGVVAILDSRMVTARYAGFLQASLPPFWPTTDRELVLGALTRLDAAAGDLLPVADPAVRGHVVDLAPVVPISTTTGAGPDGMDAVGPSPVADAVSTGAPVADAARTAVTNGHPWSEDEDADLREGVSYGLDLAELAEHLGVPEPDVAARATRLGLTIGAEPGLAFE